MSFAKIKLVCFNFYLIFFLYLESDEQLKNNFLHAARDGDIRTVKRLLRDKIPVDMSDGVGYTALHYATINNRTEVVKCLLRQGSDLNLKNRWGNTPLHWAAIHSFATIAQLLIDGGADINLKNSDNKTPLDEARRGSEVRRLLLELQKSHP